MKLLVFAHTPPPHHGQSYMVKLMLEGLGGDRRRAAPGTPPPTDIECYHVDCRYSETFEDIGSFRLEKMWLVLRYCLEAIWCRFRFGVRTFYYVPAPGKRAALYRDWVVMLLCRPFFRDFIHHWHAVGLGDWLVSRGTWFERWLTHRLLGHCSMGIALAIPSMRDALWFRSRRVEIVPNGIPDPCPDFEKTVLPRRRARVEARRRLLAGQPLSAAQRAAADGDPEVFHVLYLAHCTREKGLFDTLDAVAEANARSLREGSPLSCRLVVAGAFLNPHEEAEFQRRIAEPDLMGTVHYAGFVGPADKNVLLRQSDCLCFPTFYHAESFGLVVVEAIAAGLSVVTTRWRALPDLLPPDFSGFVSVENPSAVARALVAAFQSDGSELREEFLAQFTARVHLIRLEHAFHSLTANAGPA
ncbi:MAG: glycosyltransferase [Chthoniobacter sp.]